VKSLTSSEATVVRSLLACEAVSERERIARSGIPSRTFEGVRRRAYAEGWVYDRYVPDLVRLGRTRMRCALLQPYAERLRSVVAAWSERPGTVVVWRWEETVFVLGFDGPDDAPPTGDRSDGPGAYRRRFEVVADVGTGQVPAYFDFEGAWSRILGRDGVVAYPQGPGGGTTSRGVDRPLSPGERRELAGLLRVPLDAPTEGRPLRVSPFFFPRGHQRLLRDGAARRRVFPELRCLPPFEDRTIQRIAFVHGRLVPGRSAAGVFRRLTTMRIYPFLFATDGAQVLFATLSPAPASPAGSPRPAVLANLQRDLRTIEIVREAVDGLSVDVDHRYDRLVPR
jgi:hypothetical protein